MTTLTLADDGYERIEAAIQSIEDLAWGGMFAPRSVERFQKIVSETKKLRQTLREVLLLTNEPAPADTRGGPDAA
jgi:hypothetical protein